jgi:hypothetical protein
MIKKSFTTVSILTVRKWIGRACLITAAFWLAACSVMGLEPDSGQAAANLTPEPTETPLPSGISVVTSPLCLVQTLRSVETEELQGDMIAWSPSEYTLAWIEPNQTGNWSVGNLALISSISYEKKVPVPPNANVFGDLVWSPDSQYLALIGLRRSDGLYTVMTADMTNVNPKFTDWLPSQSASTDPYAGRKAIVEWLDEQTLRAVVSCGVDCDQMVDIDVETGERQYHEEQMRKSEGLNVYLGIGNKNLPYDAEEFPTMRDPSWSPDGQSVAYLDDRALLWILAINEKTQSLIPVPAGRPVEIKWAPDGRNIAVRTDANVFMYSMDCVE